MKSRTNTLLIVAVCALAGMTGWQWWRAEDALRMNGFLEARMRILDAENQRLGSLLETREKERLTRQDAVWRDGIVERVAALRELDFLEAVVFQTLNREDLPAIIESKIAEQHSDEEVARLARMYGAIGLLPEEFDLKQAYINLFAEQIAAFYDQHADVLHLMEGTHLDNATNRMILAHELVHALQDQHFQLELLPLELKDNDDRVLATAALVEGDATLAMGLFFARDAEPSGMVAALASNLFTQSLTALASSPPYLRESLLFPYTEGRKFATALFERGGMQAISDAFRSLPASTREILHPDEFIDPAQRFDPVMADWSEPPPGEATPLGTNVLGEFGLRVLLGQWLDSTEAAAAAKGWIGDGYRVSQTPGGSLAVEGQTWWDSPNEAQEFAKALARAWSVRWSLPDAAWTPDSPEWNARTGNKARKLSIRVSGNSVRFDDWP